MHGLGATDFMFSLNFKHHSKLITAQSYECYPHLAVLNNLDSKLTHKQLFYSIEKKEEEKLLLRQFSKVKLKINFFH